LTVSGRGAYTVASQALSVMLLLDTPATSHPALYWGLEYLKLFKDFALLLIAPVAGGGALIFVFLDWLKKRQPPPNTVRATVNHTVGLQELCDRFGQPAAQSRDGFDALLALVIDLHNGTRNVSGAHIQNLTAEAEYIRYGNPSVLKRLTNQRIRGVCSVLVKRALDAGVNGWYVADIASLPEMKQLIIRRYAAEIKSFYVRTLYDQKGAPIKFFVLGFHMTDALATLEKRGLAMAAAEEVEDYIIKHRT
jgi:hypothetical protein